MELKENKKLSITKQELIDIEQHLISLADGENIIADGGNIVYHDKFKYKHTFADGVYVRQMTIAEDEVIIGAIHKHLHVWFLLSGNITVLTDGELKEYQAPCTVLSKPGVKRVIYGNEESIFTNVHKNPTNTEDIRELEKQIVALNYEEYEEYINKNKL
jgi:quercetin dioxygenase-like cupin family protein